MTTAASGFEPRVFSGIQPSGNVHLGNYLGAIKRFVAMQESHNCVYCVVDLHAVTVWQDPVVLRQKTREVTAAFLAAGIDPSKHIVFNQSQVKEHAELAWLFNCVARMGWLSRMTQFKDKAGKNRENASVGLFAYPSLMAADILAYRATHVPVGEDQKQHLELTRDIAQKFNMDFAGEIDRLGLGVGPDKAYFPLPEPLITGAATRVMSLRDGSKKMSSSDASDLSRLNLTDDADELAKKVRKAKTDPNPLPDNLDDLADRPEARNLINIYSGLSDKAPQDVLTEYAGAEFSKFKPALADLAVETLSPITLEMRRLMDDTDHVDAVLRNGAEQARALAQPVLRDVKAIFGFVF